jgi:hypothetical protein
MTSGQGGSNAKGKLNANELTIFSQRICTGKMGSGVAKSTAIKMVVDSPPFTGRMKAHARCRFL